MTTPNEALDGPGGNAASDPLPEATGLVRGASEAGYQLKILGGLGVRVLCPDFPPRLRAGQDIDLACMGKNRKKIAAYLESAGCEPDRRFNGLNGDRQMYFTAPSGRPIDVMVDRLSMCHTLDFKGSFDSLSITLDPADLHYRPGTQTSKPISCGTQDYPSYALREPPCQADHPVRNPRPLQSGAIVSDTHGCLPSSSGGPCPSCAVLRLIT